MNEENMNTNPNMNSQRINIPGDTVKVELGKQRELGKVTEAEEAAVLWFYSYAKDRKWSLAEAGEAIDYDSSTVYRLFQGTYGAKLDKIVEAITRFRKVAEERAKRKDIGFIETSAWRKEKLGWGHFADAYEGVRQLSKRS